MYNNILIPTDGSELADKAVTHGLALAKKLGAKVTVLRVLAPPAPIIIEGVVIAYPQDEARKQVNERIEAHFAEVKAAGAAQGVTVECRRVENNEPWRGIVDAGNEMGASLIVMASHGRRGVSALVLGSETQKVLTHSAIPVLVYR